MRPIYRKVLKARFSEMLRALDPPFREFEGSSSYIRSSDYAYARRAKRTVLLFLVLHINSKGWQSFTVEFGWSRLERFPEVLWAHFPDLTVDPKRLKLKEYRQRIRVFLDGDKWWFLEPRRDIKLQFSTREVPRAEAERLVADALAEVKQIIEVYVVPYFQKFLTRAGK